MSYFRSYFSKNNTIIKDSSVNTAKNPNTELIYGSTFSKFIFKIDTDELKSRIDNGDYVLDVNTKHYLNITNTIFGDEALLGAENGKGRERTTSFDLIIFTIPENEFWDEGVGFDYEYVYDFSVGNETFDVRPSNWFNRTSLNEWSQEGIYSTVPPSGTTLATIHFDNGNEDIHEDITEYINEILTGSTVNQGLGIAFHPDFMDISNTLDQSVAFYTMYTQTFFEPYLETIFDDNIIDDRNNFIAEKMNNLYLYVTKGTNYYDLDYLPLVDVLNSTSTVMPGLSDLCASKVRKGVYKVSFGLDGQLCDGRRFFYDQWKDLTIDGFAVPSITQKFIPKPYLTSYSIGDDITEQERFIIQFFGVNLNEKIKRGSKRKIVVTVKSINQQKGMLLDDVYYRIYIKEGHTQINIFDWTRLDKTNQNSFVLDTSFMIPREYWIEIKAKAYTEEIFYRDEIKFEIISER